MIPTRLWRINSFVPAIVASSTHCTSPSGAPAASEASLSSRTDSQVQRRALGWGLITIALPALTAIKHLKKAVDVGLVVGSTAATTPTGTAISVMPRSGCSPSTPMVLSGAIFWCSRSEFSRFFAILSRTLPYPVSSTAILASGSAWARAVAAMRATMASTCS